MNIEDMLYNIKSFDVINEVRSNGPGSSKMVTMSDSFAVIAHLREARLYQVSNNPKARRWGNSIVVKYFHNRGDAKKYCDMLNNCLNFFDVIEKVYHISQHGTASPCYNFVEALATGQQLDCGMVELLKDVDEEED